MLLLTNEDGTLKAKKIKRIIAISLMICFLLSVAIPTVSAGSTKTYGIDISKWQKGMDLAKAKNEGVKFVIIRGMYGNEKDTSFDTHYKNAKAAGLKVGAYQYTRAVNAAQAREEAKLFISKCLKGKQFEYPIYIDVEDNTLQKLSKNQVDAIITAWCDEMEKAGYFAGFYCNDNWFKNEMNGAELMKKYTYWNANWNTITTKYPMQQFSGGTKKVAGMNCDQDYCYIDFPLIIVNGGFNGYKK